MFEYDLDSGVIEFGDMLYAPLIADVSIGCSYHRTFDGHPLALMSEFVAGYNAVTGNLVFGKTVGYIYLAVGA